MLSNSSLDEAATLQARSVRRIMMLASEYPPALIGGLGTHVYELATGLGREGCEVYVVAPTLASAETERDKNVRVRAFAKQRGTEEVSDEEREREPLKIVDDFNDELAAHARNVITEGGFQPQVIHCHEWFTFPAACQLREMFGIPIVGTVHLLQHPIWEWWGAPVKQEVGRFEMEMYNRMDMLITVSRSMRGLLRDFHGVAEERIQVVYNGFDDALFRQPALQKSYLDKLRASVAAPDEKIVIFAGRLALQKGISALFESASRVASKFPRVRYLIAGEPDSAETTQLIDYLFREYPSLKKRVKMLRKLPRKQLAMLYQIADVAVVPSIYEPFGYAATEAMAAGVPVVATEVGGLAEIIEHGESGLLVPVHETEPARFRVEVEKLAAAQLMLLKDEELARRLGQAGRERVARMFNLEQMIQNTRQVYAQTLRNAEVAAALDH